MELHRLLRILQGSGHFLYEKMESMDSRRFCQKLKTFLNCHLVSFRMNDICPNSESVVCDVTLLLALVKFVQLLYVQSAEAFSLPHNRKLVPTDQSFKRIHTFEGYQV